MKTGDTVPGFALTDLDGATHRLADYAGEVVVLDFWSAECPWSRHYDAWLVERAAVWTRQGVRFLAVASNASEPAALIRAAVAERGISFPVLLDSDCTLADRFGAVTTPHMFVIDSAGRLAYQGAIDDRTFRKRQPGVNYLEQAIAALQAGRLPEPAMTDPYGCTIVRVVDEGVSA